MCLGSPEDLASGNFTTCSCIDGKLMYHKVCCTCKISVFLCFRCRRRPRCFCYPVCVHKRVCDSCAQCLYLVLWSAVQYTRCVISMIRCVRYLVTLLLFGFCSSEMYWYLNRKRISWASGGRERHLRLLGVRAVASRWANCLQDGMGFEISSCFQIERTARR